MLWVGVAIAVCAAASFFFALAESALFSLGQWQGRRLVASAGPRGAALAGLLENPRDVLATIVLGNTFSNGGLMALGVVLGIEGVWDVWLAIAGLLVLVLVFCEVAPKTLAVRAPEQWALRVAGPMAVWVRLTGPLRAVAQRMNDVLLGIFLRRLAPAHAGVTDEEYRELLELGFQSGSLGAAEKEIITQIIRLDRRTVRDVMRPRSQVACIPDDLTVGQMVEEARRHKHRRLPMYDETPDTIVGVLNTQLLLADPGRDLSEVIEFPSFVPSGMNLLQLLKSLQRQQRGVAIVLDEYGGMDGLVTLEDILEDLIGEIRGEGETHGFIMERLGSGRWRVSGTMRLEDFRREYPALGDGVEAETLGGLVLGLFEHVPAVGQSVRHRGLLLTVRAADERRIRELLVEADTGRATRTGRGSV